jgi:hypothetical protein
VISSQAISGTWTAYPGQSTLYKTDVQQPINADGSSRFKFNNHSVIPVKFRLSTGRGPLIFHSIWSDQPPKSDPEFTDYSYVSFDPSTDLTFSQITSLTASYQFTDGDCGGGSLRWEIDTPNGNLFIYYGDAPNFSNCPGSTWSGVNMVGSSVNGDLRYDTSQFQGGTFYDTYEHAKALLGSTPIDDVALVLDSGWVSDQRVTLTSAAVNGNQFTPLPQTSLSPTCVRTRPDATIEVTKLTGTTTQPVNEPVSIQPKDDNLHFRKVDCKYMYNLATSSLDGIGHYEVDVVIDGDVVAGGCTFYLRA